MCAFFLQTKISEAHRKARLRVRKEMDIASATHNSQSMEEAMSEALKRVKKENEVSYIASYGNYYLY